jgi:hypothetical protein
VTPAPHQPPVEILASAGLSAWSTVQLDALLAAGVIDDDDGLPKSARSAESMAGPHVKIRAPNRRPLRLLSLPDEPKANVDGARWSRKRARAVARASKRHKP